MRFPMQLNVSLTKYIMKMKIEGKKRFPLVLMIEPLHLCNLACMGCGRIREYKDTLQDMLSVEQCLAAVDECGAPIVSICGGEPLIYPQIGELVEKILEKGKHIYLCTNSLRLSESLAKFKPSPYLNINPSIDGLEKTQEITRGRKGIFDIQMKAITDAKERGFRVVVNTTVYKESELSELEELFDRLTKLKVDGILVTPGFSYGEVESDIFLDRQESIRKFKHIASLSKKYRFFNTPMYMHFLAGERQLRCTPWGSLTYNPQGWKAPCYLITDKHYERYADMMAEVDWERYIERRDPRCKNCMMHSGVEPTAVEEVGKSAKDIYEIIRWNLA